MEPDPVMNMWLGKRRRRREIGEGENELRAEKMRNDGSVRPGMFQGW